MAASVLAAQQPAAKPKANYIPIAEAKKAEGGQMVYIRGQVLSFARPRPDSQQPYSIYIADASDSIRAVIFQDVWKQIADSSFIEKGAKIDLYAEAGEYQGTRQVVVLKPTHIRRTPGTATAADMAANRRGGENLATVSIGGLNAWSIGNRVRVRGTVATFEPSDNPRLPHRVTLKDATGEIEVIYWAKVAEQIAESERPAVNLPLQAIGEVTEFRGKLQVRVDEPAGISRQFKSAGTAKQESAAVPRRKPAAAAF